MTFGWINLMNGILLALMLLPNLFYALRNRGQVNRSKSRLMNVLEQIGRYGCMILMMLPLFVWKFAFKSAEGFVVYLLGNGALLAVYLVTWLFYWKRQSKAQALILAVVPSCIFLLTGLTLRHFALVLFAVLFAVGHIYVTIKNLEEENV